MNHEEIGYLRKDITASVIAIAELREYYAQTLSDLEGDLQEAEEKLKIELSR